MFGVERWRKVFSSWAVLLFAIAFGAFVFFLVLPVEIKGTAGGLDHPADVSPSAEPAESYELILETRGAVAEVLTNSSTSESLAQPSLKSGLKPPDETTF